MSLPPFRVVSGVLGSANSAAPPVWIGPCSDLKEAAELETPETKLQKIHGVLFESAPDAMMVSDPDGRILQLNARPRKRLAIPAKR